MTEEEIREFLEDDNHCPFSIDDVSDEDLLTESGKMKLTLELVLRLRNDGQWVSAIFTYRRKLSLLWLLLPANTICPLWEGVAAIEMFRQKNSSANILQDIER